MPQSASTRSSSRRSDGGGSGSGVTSLSFNGGPALTGALSIRSPMLANTGASPIRIDNGNVKYLTPADTIVGIDVDLNQSFELQLDRATALMSAPTASIITTPRDGEKITFTFKQFSETVRAITWATGAGAYVFALASSAGVTLAQFNAQMALLVAGGTAGALLKISFEYNSDLDRWYASGLAGVWQTT